MATPPTIVSQPVNRQTIPYADRPLVRIQGGLGYLTQEGYQFLQRLGQGLGATLENVGSIIEVTNTIAVDIGTIEAEIGTLFADIGSIEAEISAGLAGIPPFPQPPPPQPLQQTPPAPAMPPLPSAAPLWPSAAPVMVTALPVPEPVRGPPPVAGWTFLSRVDAAASSGIVFVLPAGFGKFHLSLQDVVVSSASATLAAQFSQDGGATFINGAGAYAQFGMQAVNAVATAYDATDTGARLSLGNGTTATDSLVGEFDLYPGTGSLYGGIDGTATGNDGTHFWRLEASNVLTTAGVVNAFQIVPSAGNFTGTFLLWGLA